MLDTRPLCQRSWGFCALPGGHSPAGCSNTFIISTTTPRSVTGYLMPSQPHRSFPKNTSIIVHQTTKISFNIQGIFLSIFVRRLQKMIHTILLLRSVIYLLYLAFLVLHKNGWLIKTKQQEVLLNVFLFIQISYL